MSKDSIFAWDPTAANNSDIAGTDISGATGKVKDGDNALRTIMAQIAANDVQRGSDIATASTVDFTAATTPALTHDLTGTVTVTAVTMTATHWRVCRAQGVFQLTASSTLVVNGSTSTNYTTTAGDLLVFFGYSASTVRVWTVTGGSQTPASATTSAQGIVELATVAEALAGTDAVRAVTPNGLYFPTGHLYGLTLSTNATDATNDIDIAAGTARDASDSFNYVVASAIGKQLDVAWAMGGTPGATTGGLDTGSVGNNRYAIWGIGRSDTQVRNVLFSLSFTAPTMPTNYDYKVLLGEVTRSGGVNGTPIWYGGQRPATGIYQGMHLLAQGNVSSAATLDIVLTSYTGYRGLMFVLNNFIPATNSADLYMRVSSNGGSSYDAGASNYIYSAISLNSGTATAQLASSGGATQINLTANASPGSGSSEGTSVQIALMDQNNAAIKPKISYSATDLISGGANVQGGPGVGVRTAAQITNAVRFLFSSGNIASGSYAVYGYT